MKLGTLVLAPVASAHTLFTTLFINGKNQGDGTCVRMPSDHVTANGPIYPITGDDMACGRDGGNPVAFTCPVPQGATLTLQMREWTDGSREGFIAPEHKGPCSVYVKKVDDMGANNAAGPGWVKIWESGYDASSGEWCVDKLIKRKGFLSVRLPPTLPAGYYLVRPEILALHNAVKGDPQFYLGCAQIFVQRGPSGPLRVPAEFSVSIPGHVSPDTPGPTFNIYDKSQREYPIPGPKVYVPEGEPSPSCDKKQTQGLIPDSCVVKNANWCAKPLAGFTTKEGCWESVKDCWSQSKACWNSSPPSGGVNCQAWEDYCKGLEQQCGSGNDVSGPVEFEAKNTMKDLPAEALEPLN
ncbi:Glycoside hydrolase, family 61 [Metarhizium album ARSEF 1941]|uniref:lytic cellulose monooxygenase (C4-dehydrogenating) n=1 Tax=Metarhizium album (strain ARSEF 1941) TaxID=1081103 RepID=A0A0B2WLY9_METAS|nr:Glycoside hydrolase, family 61 [Metarhizium album ARSEF 1941]KHN97071.1 Glycoside hydrolase, family 61 [Metarhizium album ARSEF 1941]